MKFEVGDKVRIKNSSQYKGQHKGYGEITNNSGTYTVTWSDGYQNSYREHDLEIKPGSKETPKNLTKMAYKPGTKILDHVKNILSLSTDEDRKKQLRTFQQCVLPKSVQESIEEAMTVVLRAEVFDEWGINEHFEKGLTNSILLYGPPGTGKTMISESIAAVIGKNLMTVSSGDIQSNIPGQTEKNIQETFAKAKKTDCVVMLDECDSILSDRNMVGVILGAEINTLLTEIERFPGVIVLTTNRLHRLDAALQRRIINKVELDIPDKKARKQIWNNLVPPKMPLEKGVCYKKLSEPVLTGGEIKNAILLAARKAIAKNLKKVAMAHFVDAVNGILKSKDDFEDSRPRRIDDMMPSVDKVRSKVGKDKVAP